MPVGSTTTTQDWSEQVRRLAHAALDLLFPRRCAVCRRPGTALCEPCIQTFIRITDPICPICGDLRPAPGRCNLCANGRSFHSVRSAFQFSGGVRQAIHAFKYEQRRELAAPLAQSMTLALPSPDPTSCLCAVPLHPNRMAQRGYNQAFLIARNLADFWPVELVLPEQALRRMRDTSSQVGLDYAGRQTNVGDAFCADPNWVRQKQIVLIDDVCTTGATLDACAVALHSAGAASVRAVTLARAV